MRSSIIAVLSLVLFTTLSFGQVRVQNAFIHRESMPESGTTSVVYQDKQEIPHKSVLLAVTMSMLLPGAGEAYAGNFESGKYALLAEGAIWVTYAAFYTHGNWVRRDARVFAAQHAGANFTSKADKFDVDIGNYVSVDEYNKAKLRNRELDLLYTDPSFSWNWDTDADRLSFKNERIRSDQMYQNAKFVIAAAVINRVLSAFSAGRAASAFNRKALIEGAWNLEVYPTSTNTYADGMNLEFSFTF